jgi:hypothetical protein
MFYNKGFLLIEIGFGLLMLSLVAFIVASYLSAGSLLYRRATSIINSVDMVRVKMEQLLYAPTAFESDEATQANIIIQYWELPDPKVSLQLKPLKIVSEYKSMLIGFSLLVSDTMKKNGYESYFLTTVGIKSELNDFL